MPTLVETLQANWQALPASSRLCLKRALAAASGAAAGVLESAINEPAHQDWHRVVVRSLGAGLLALVWLNVHPGKPPRQP